jgi:signal transduction histidine kinase
MNDDPHFAARVVLPALRQEGRWAGEIDVRHKDGRVFPIWLATALIEGARGRPMAAVGVIRDMSERKRAEEELRSYAGRLEEANRLKELFADILRHDLLGPVSTVRLSLEMLLQRGGDPLSKRLLERASRNCSKLTEMIESAAKYAKVSTLQEIEFGRVDLGAVLAEVIAQNEPLAEAREARIELAGGGAYPARAHPMIADVFANLVSNAVKYGPARGQVTVEVQDAGDRWRVSVADRGGGIPDGDKGRVFTRFERLAKEGVQGTGLGLAIAKRIVEMHHGAIEIADNPGGGAVFRVTLPKA